MTQGMADLAQISGMLRDRDLAAVERIIAHLNQIAADIARIEAARAARASNDAIDTARLTGMDVRWQSETERTIRILRQREAVLRVQHEAALSKVRLAFGRAEVTARLAGLKPPV